MKAQLVKELSELRQRVAQLEASESERGRAEEALRESEERFRELVEAANDIIYTHDLQGNFTSVNPAARRIYGYTSEEILELNIAQIVDPEYLPLARQKIQEKLEGAPRSGPYELLTYGQGGEPIWVEVSTRLMERDGQPIGVQGIARDITQRKRAEEALRESEERLRTAGKAAYDLIYEWDVASDVLEWFGDVDGLLGYREGEISRDINAWLDLIHPEDRSKLENAVELHRTSTEPIQYEYRVRHKDGTYRHWNDHGLPLLDAKGRPYKWVGVCTDITERKRAEEALRESEERFRELVESANDVIYTHDLQGNFSSANPAATRIYGYTNEEILQLNIAHIVDPEHLPLARQKIRAKLDGVPQTGPYELLTYSKAGEPIWVEVSTRLLERDGQPVGVLGIARDITDRKQAEEELQRSFEKLQRALEGTAHTLVATIEIKDPYTAGHQRRATQLACAIAKEMDLPQQQIEGLRMAGLIHDIGKISVPAEVLSKPGQLNDIEWGLIKAHPKVGYEVLKSTEFPWPVAEIVLQHHERVDGSGYPQGLSGDSILMKARILAVADVVEAMSSHRPYRPARGLDEALEEISQNRGILYDPEVVDACLKLFTEKGFTFEDGVKALRGRI